VQNNRAQLKQTLIQ